MTEMALEELLRVRDCLGLRGLPPYDLDLNPGAKVQADRLLERPSEALNLAHVITGLQNDWF